MFYFQFDHTFFFNLRMSRMPAILQVRNRVKGEKKELLRNLWDGNTRFCVCLYGINIIEIFFQIKRYFKNQKENRSSKNLKELKQWGKEDKQVGKT